MRESEPQEGKRAFLENSSHSQQSSTVVIVIILFLLAFSAFFDVRGLRVRFLSHSGWWCLWTGSVDTRGCLIVGAGACCRLLGLT